jgi:hypothetical protein
LFKYKLFHNYWNIPIRMEDSKSYPSS